VLRSIVPEFSEASPVNDAIREFVSNEVLKACITSLHEPYFVDLQKELAQLIAAIILLYDKKTRTPKEILKSLPGVTDAMVETTIERMLAINSSRAHRALILELLGGVRGVSISELGKIQKSNGQPKKERTLMQQQFMIMNEERGKGSRDRESPDLEGVAGMFG
jgi:exportin-5